MNTSSYTEKSEKKKCFIPENLQFQDRKWFLCLNEGRAGFGVGWLSAGGSWHLKALVMNRNS